jgi:hypothetical protein
LNFLRIVKKAFVLILLSGNGLAWNLPATYQSFKTPKDETLILDYMIVEVNGQVKKVNRDEEISFVRGDIIKITEAYLKNSKQAVDAVEISGFATSEDSKDVRNRLLDTSASLIEKEGSLDLEGSVYVILSHSASFLHGVIYLRRVEPTLSYIDVLVNGKNRVMREGETLEVKKTDHFKVVNVVTNFANAKNVSFTIAPILSQRNGKDKRQNFEIIFRHKEYVFAKIPIEIESL